jgi:hypothetical protein
MKIKVKIKVEVEVEVKDSGQECPAPHAKMPGILANLGHLVIAKSVVT